MIPKIIHHVWPGDDAFRPELHGWRKTWIDKHPDWSLMFWRLGYPWGEAVEYPGLGELLARPDLTVVVKSDVLRWFTLVAFGGVYVDTDFECHAPLDALRSEGLFCGTEMDATTLSPSLVGAERGHPLANRMLDASIAMVAIWSTTPERVKELNTRPQELTGPRLFDALAKGKIDPKLPIELPIDVAGPEFSMSQTHPIVVHGLDDLDWLDLVRDRVGAPLVRPRYARHHWTGCRTDWGWSVRMQRGNPNYGHGPTSLSVQSPPAAPPPALDTERPPALEPHAEGNGGAQRAAPSIPVSIPGAVHTESPSRISLGSSGAVQTDSPSRVPLGDGGVQRVPVANIPGAVHTESPGRIPIFGDGPFDRPTQFKPQRVAAVLPENPSALHPQVAVPASHETQARQIERSRIPSTVPLSERPPAPAPAPASRATIPGYETFFEWYAPGGNGSGPGSAPEYTERFRGWLQVFLREQGIKSVLDFGCGDWSWAKLVDWTGIDYLGVEIVPEVVRGLQMQFQRKGVEGKSEIAFELIDPRTIELPTDFEVDLVLCKDVLQHLPSSEIIVLVTKLARAARHCLWCNDRHGPRHDNRELKARGSYRSLDLSAPPFSLPGRYAFEFGQHPDQKVVYWQPGLRA